MLSKWLNGEKITLFIINNINNSIAKLKFDLLVAKTNMVK